MGAFSRVKEITLPANPEQCKAWGWDAHETVTIKNKFTVGDMEDSTSIQGTAEDGTPNVTVSSSKMLDAMITSWNLTDDAGNVVPKSLEAVRQLPMNYVEPILDAIDKVSKKGAVGDPKSFLRVVPAPTSAT